MTRPNSSPYVDTYYKMDPATEDLLFDGYALRDGMKVLVEDDAFRVMRGVSPIEHQNIKNIWSRWCTVSQLRIVSGGVVFVGIYDDGHKNKLAALLDVGWYVKKDTIPVDDSTTEPEEQEAE